MFILKLFSRKYSTIKDTADCDFRTYTHNMDLLFDELIELFNKIEPLMSSKNTITSAKLIKKINTIKKSYVRIKYIKSQPIYKLNISSNVSKFLIFEYAQSIKKIDSVCKILNKLNMTDAYVIIYKIKNNIIEEKSKIII